MNLSPKNNRAILIGLACLLGGLAAHAAIDPRFKSEAMPEGTRLEMAHTVVNELKSTTEWTSPTAAQCLAIRSRFNGQRIHLRLQANNFVMTKIPPFDDIREELWSRFVVEEESSCSGWVMMSRTLGGVDGPCTGVTGFVGITALVPFKPKM